jgi:ABC-type multidrug transport system ATPase subunit
MRAREYLDFLADARGLAGSGRKDAVDHALTRSGVDAHASLRALSDGSARRLALAAALLHAPGGVFIDGPLLHLDPAGRRDVRRWIADARQQGASVVIAADSLEDGLDLWTRGVVLHGGRIAKIVDPQSGAAGLSDLLAGL